MPELAFEPLRVKVLERLESLSKGLVGLRIPAWGDPGGAGAHALGEMRRRLEDHIRYRFGRGLGAPAVVVLFGGTGVGKSTILNTLAGRAVTETSARRPCTTEPLLYHHVSATAALESAEFLPAYAKKAQTPGQPKAGSMGVEFLPHEDPALASLVLVDAPDFDSVERENRRVAEDLYRVADLVIFVVNPSKYADEETWRAIRRAKADGKAAAYVFNRAEPDDPALADFRTMAEGAAVVEVPRDPGAPAAGRLADPAVKARIEAILSGFLLGDAADRLRLAELARSWDAFAAGLENAVLPPARAAAAALAAGRASATAASGDMERALVEEIRLDQTNDLERISRMVRENLFSLVGTLTRPVVGAIAALYDRISGALGRTITRNKPEIENALARVHENNRQAARKHFGLAHERLARDLAASPHGAELAAGKDFAAALMPAQELEDRYIAGLKEFEDWKRGQFEALVGDIRTKKSAQLFVLQVLYVGLTIATMAHTGGAFTVAEGFAAPFIITALDKMFVGAINWDLVRDLEARGRKRFFEIFAMLCREQAARWEKLVAREEAGLAGLKSLEEDLAALRPDVPALLEALAKR